MKTIEAIVHENGEIELLQPLKLSGPRRAVVTILEETQSAEARPIGLAKGQFEVPADFDAPLPDDVLDDFYFGALTRHSPRSL